MAWWTRQARRQGKLSKNQSLSLTITKVWGVVVVVVVEDRMDQQLTSYPLMSHYLKEHNNCLFDMVLFTAYILYKKITSQKLKFNQLKPIFMFCWLCISVNETNLVPNLFLVYLHLSSLHVSGKYGPILHTRQSSTQNNKHQVSHKHSCFSWWWAHSCPKHVEIDKCKYTKNKLCTKLVSFTRLNSSG